MPDRLRLDSDTWERAVEIFERAIRGMLAADLSDGDMIDRGLEGVADLTAGSVPDHPLQVGDVIGNFEVVGELGDDTLQASVVECRFFGGLDIDETAEALNLSTATVKRDWRVARAWLAHTLSTS